MAVQEFQASDGWSVKLTKSHMLESTCCDNCETRLAAEGSAAKLCTLCSFSQQFPFPLPEEVYAENTLTITAPDGCSFKLSARQALQGIEDVTEDTHMPKVAHAAEWRAARDLKGIEGHKPYDWTYTSHCTGDATGPWSVVQCEKPGEGLNVDLVRKPEKILFRGEAFLLADDYGDNGIMNMDFKIRCMPSSIYVLQRQFVRVDGVLLRLCDTRIFHEIGTNLLVIHASEHELNIPSVLEKLGPQMPDGRPSRMMLNPENVNGLMPHFEERKTVTTHYTCSSPLQSDGTTAPSAAS
eukprot:m.23542 g.23542  ORF g.23542 m.23542 type:complete len:296 (-) comp8515_c0_seq2:1466-2353(-)